VSLNTLMQDLSNAGFQAVLMPIPLPTVACYFQKGGWQYREQFFQQLDTVMDAIEATNGQAKNVAGGISFGGLHAMMAFASVGRFEAWFARVPVTYIDQPSEFPSVGDVPRFNSFWAIPAFIKSIGWISYGTLDTRVNWQLTAKLAAQFSPSVTVRAYAGQDHSTNLQNIADIFSFRSSLP
jgi:dienelactone hydrolase